MTKKEFLARIGNAWEMGLCTPEVLKIADKWLDFVMRYEGGQQKYVDDFLEDEGVRLHNFEGKYVLANDTLGYKTIQLLAILTHSCQICAVDPNAWHTRSGFCPHRKK